MPASALPPFLTDEEIAAVCDPLTQPAAQRKYLESLGLVVKPKPNGKPLVGRAHFDAVMAGGAPQVSSSGTSPREPNRAALIALHRNRTA